MTTIELAEFQRLLEEERERVRAAIENLHQENPGSLADETSSRAPDNHLAETASVTLDREIDYTLEENSEHVLAAINVALARIEAGTYGACQRCGREIAPERLRAIPWVTLCIDCKREVERG